MAEVVTKECSEPCNAAAHETCNTELEEPECQCAPGYEGAPCRWVGVLSDRGFADPEAWTATNGATVLPFEEGPTDLGVALFAPSVVCTAGAVGQTVDMPSTDAGEPLVAELTYLAQDAHGVAVGFNRAWKTLPMPSGDWQTARFCLGEAAPNYV